MPPIRPITTPDRTDMEPLYVGNTPPKNPFQGLEHITGIDHTDPQVREIAKRVRTVQQRLHGMLVIRTETDTDSDIRKVIATEGIEHVGPSAPIYEMNEEGTGLDLHTTNLKVLEEIGGWTLDFDRGMQERYAMLGDVNTAQLAFLGSLIECKEADTALLTGASAGPEIPVLKAAVEKHGALLLCHDVVPAAAHKAYERYKETAIPYAVLPPHVLSEVFDEKQRPKSIVARNVASSMSTGGVGTLLNTMRNTGAKQLLISQSVGFATEAPIIDPRMYFKNKIGQEWMPKIIKRHPEVLPSFRKVNANPEATKLLAVQLECTFAHILWEYVRQYITGFAQRDMQKPTHTLMSEGWEDVSQRRARVRLGRLFGQEMVQQFERGEFNTLSTSPFGFKRTNESGVEQGDLRVRGTQCTFIVGDQPELPRKQQNFRTHFVDSNEPLVPQEWRFITPESQWVHIKPVEESLKAHAQSLGAWIAHALTSVYSYQDVHPLFTQHGEVPRDERDQKNGWLMQHYCVQK